METPPLGGVSLMQNSAERRITNTTLQKDG